ncbi:hypothetical protein [Pedobacter agri]|uniref:Uncharacterized protein n=1 Tax=Pedobacter agri TaxID=454586 RepID=A0A9X3I908_9SPHI|nr:hypothetical protein [Pedobacter agri]MCX3264805.1 hypothetical protein [Pedobacter agri]
MAKQSEKQKEENQGPLNDIPVINECFIITPIGEYNSETFVKAMGLINSVINPVLKEFNFKATPANEINTSGSINKQIIKRILEDKLAIANLTDLNPNVMYELALRHAARLPVITMAEKGTRLPFDITDQRTIFYIDSLAGSEAAKPQLRAMIEEALTGELPENPIYDVLQQESILKNVKQDDPINLLMNTVNQMETKFMNAINDIKNSSFQSKPSPPSYPNVQQNRSFNISGTADSSIHNMTTIVSSLHQFLKKVDNNAAYRGGSLTSDGKFDVGFTFSKLVDDSYLRAHLIVNKIDGIQITSVNRL